MSISDTYFSSARLYSNAITGTSSRGDPIRSTVFKAAFPAYLTLMTNGQTEYTFGKRTQMGTHLMLCDIRDWVATDIVEVSGNFYQTVFLTTADDIWSKFGAHLEVQLLGITAPQIVVESSSSSDSTDESSLSSSSRSSNRSSLSSNSSVSSISSSSSESPDMSSSSGSSESSASSVSSQSSASLVSSGSSLSTHQAHYKVVSGDGNSGSGSPNGAYTYDGLYGTYDSFSRDAGGFYIWRTGNWWVISTAKGSISPSWRLPSNGPDGIYSVQLGTTGQAIVEGAP